MSLQLLRGGIWACMRCPVYVFVGFWVGDYVSQLPYVRYYVGVKSSFQHAQCSWGMRVQEDLCVLGALCLICQDRVSSYFYFLLLPLGPEL